MVADRHALAAEAIDRRPPPADAGPLAAQIVAVAGVLADRIADGGRLLVTGTDVTAIDAAHVAVEFVHPVIVGKRAVPALALAPEALRPGAGDVVVGLLLDETPPVADALERCRRSGATTVALHAGDRPPGADLAVALAGADVLVARESLVTAYHLLWEVVHELVDARHPAGGRADDAGDDLTGLYPFLFHDGGPETGALESHVEASTARKLREVTDLRRDVLRIDGDRLVDVAHRLAAGGTTWTFGNGGSSTDARALAHLLGSSRLAGAPVEAHALPDDVATVTALANDVTFEVVYARMLRTLARAGDTAVALSTSGSSANVLAGLDAARELGLRTVGIAGHDGGAMATSDSVDELFVVPSSSVHRIQEAQTTLLHLLVAGARR